ncbi:hypothetical protein BKA62DRAFT_715640 [Auriculariales sp. MPI-PUGE-AT-0066]|nr:hypothetical protein BKA62DRAFT_715640 [Auriculariales sp. MPI-PUGE-AT-0066]
MFDDVAKWCRRLLCSTKGDHVGTPLLHERYTIYNSSAFTQGAAFKLHIPNTIPSDILGAIFEAVLVMSAPPIEEDELPPKLFHSRLRAPFDLAAVNRAWRALALDTSSLWTYIAVPAFASHLDPFSGPYKLVTTNAIASFGARWIALTQLLLERSRNSPLDLRVCEVWSLQVWLMLSSPQFKPFEQAYRWSDAVFTMLNPHKDRIRSIRVGVHGRSSVIWNLLGSKSSQDNPSGPTVSSDPQRSALRLAGIQSLMIERRVLIILSFPHEDSIRVHNVVFAPSTHVTRLVLQDNAMGWIWKTITSCAHSLQELTLTIFAVNGDWYQARSPSAPQSLQLPRLQKLNIKLGTHVHEDFAMDCLPRLTSGAVSLNTLRLDTSTGGREFVSQCLEHCTRQVRRIELCLTPDAHRPVVESVAKTIRERLSVDGSNLEVHIQTGRVSLCFLRALACDPRDIKVSFHGTRLCIFTDELDVLEDLMAGEWSEIIDPRNIKSLLVRTNFRSRSEDNMSNFTTRPLPDGLLDLKL